MNAELQRAQDMLAAMQAQRDNALNAMVMAQAEIAMLRRRVSELEQSLPANADPSGCVDETRAR